MSRPSTYAVALADLLAHIGAAPSIGHAAEHIKRGEVYVQVGARRWQILILAGGNFVANEIKS